MAKDFDYIVIGGGSAGCVVASRLSEDSATSVCLIEAGGNNNNRWMKEPLTSVIMNVPKKGKTNWGFDSVPQKGLNGRTNFQPRGKGLGGSSAINGMLYVRGHAQDYDEWAAAGNPGWAYKDVLPYFKKSEDNTRGADEYHGTGGLLKVTDRTYSHHSHHAFIDAAADMGLGTSKDFNGKDQEGAGWYQLTQQRAMRCSSSYAFIEPFRDRPNLKVRTNTRVLRLLFKGSKAIGVEIKTKDKTDTFYAKKEIILSAGALQSPQILQLSGVGNSRVLNRMGIDVVYDLPGVGENLQDHVDIGLVYSTPDESFWGDSSRKLFPAIKTVIDYLFFRRGKIASVLYEAGGFFKTDNAEIPDIQMHFMPSAGMNHGRTLLRGHGLGLHVCVLRPQSRGSVSISSADPLADPLIDLKLLEDQNDVDCLLKGVKLAQKILSHDLFKKYQLKDLLFDESMTDDEMIDVLRRYSNTVYHPVGTCKMGSDKMAVVDHELRVHGIQNLRVADASIMPTLVGGNTNAPSIMIGEKCADLIRNPSATSQAVQATKKTAVELKEGEPA